MLKNNQNRQNPTSTCLKTGGPLRGSSGALRAPPGPLRGPSGAPPGPSGPPPGPSGPRRGPPGPLRGPLIYGATGTARRAPAVLEGFGGQVWLKIGRNPTLKFPARLPSGTQIVGTWSRVELPGARLCPRPGCTRVAGDRRRWRRAGRSAAPKLGGNYKNQIKALSGLNRSLLGPYKVPNRAQ
jgi:hypothetical protein